jgi:hypothetical protein
MIRADFEDTIPQVPIQFHEAPISKMDFWTPEDRNAFIQDAIHSGETKGHADGYYFNVFPKIESAGDIEKDKNRSYMTDTIAAVMYSNKEFRKIPLKFYDDLVLKIANHPKLMYHFNKDIMVLVKGSNAYRYLVTDPVLKEDFPFSDLDISICINPFLPGPIFDAIKKDVEIIVKQSISQFKRTVDHMLFIKKHIDTQFISDETVEAFKNAVNEAVMNMETGEAANGQFVSPFVSDEFRNACSRHSFLITNSVSHENSVVRIELPHFDKCERIPLRRTPLFCSFNETIDFARDGHDKKGRFNLFRLRMNALYADMDENNEVTSKERVPVDFIDVSVPFQDDAELLDFWSYGRALMVYDDAGSWLSIPDVVTCVRELERILHEYDCPEYKREKRVKRLAILKSLLQG